MSAAYCPPSPEFVQISYYPNQMAKASKSSRRRVARAIRKINCSKASPQEKEKQIHQLYAKEEQTANQTSRKTLIPKTPKTSKTTGSSQTHKKTPPIKAFWPEVHAEMELCELTTARTDLVAMLNGQGQENRVPLFFRDADAACTALGDTAITLRAHICNGGEQNTVPIGLYISAARYIEHAIERLTCEILDRSNSQIYRHEAGSYHLRLLADSCWKPIENKIKASIEAVKNLLEIGDMLTKGIKEGQWPFVRGILETLRVLSVTKENSEIDGDEGSHAPKISRARKTCLMSKAAFIERAKGGYKDTYINNLKPAVTNYYSLLACMDDNLATPLRFNGVTGISEHLLFITSRNSLRIHTGSSTGRTEAPLGSTASKGIKRTREIYSKPYRETESRDSDSSDEDKPSKIEEHGSSKRLKPNLDISLLSEPKQGSPRRETLAMKKFRMRIEKVKIYDDGVDEGTGGGHDETNGGVQKKMNSVTNVVKLA